MCTQEQNLNYSCNFGLAFPTFCMLLSTMSLLCGRQTAGRWWLPCPNAMLALCRGYAESYVIAHWLFPICCLTFIPPLTVHHLTLNVSSPFLITSFT